MSDGADGIILLNEYDLFLKEFKAQVPTVGVLMENSYGGTISTVNLDPWSAAQMAVEFFEERGFKKVSIISSHKPVFVTRGRCFATIWREKGYECELIIAQYEEDIEFDKGRGYLFTSDQFAHNYSEDYLQKTGYLLNDKHVILGMDGKQLIDPNFHRFPSIAINWKSVGEIAFNECLSRINNPTIAPKNITFTGKKLF
jgi:DNA-binding LacI/PurR family transcriptional regulator